MIPPLTIILNVHKESSVLASLAARSSPHNRCSFLSLLSLSSLSSLQPVSPQHVENIHIGGPFFSPLIHSHPSILSPLSLNVFLFLCRKREVLIVNRERCQRQKKRAAYFWIQAARFTEAYFYHEKPTWNGTAMRSCWSNLL